MNERIKQLAEQAGMNIKTNVIGTALVFGTFEGYKTSHITVEELEMFAELVAAQEREWQGLTLEDAIRDAYMADVLTIRTHILALNDPHLEDAWAGIETLAAVALRVMAKTNPSKLRSEMVTVGISALL